MFTQMAICHLIYIYARGGERRGQLSDGSDGSLTGRGGDR